ncbi:uncharacterized protein LOC115889366 [Sitophilus oryzae]|uniref:Uncharacterized protein LOC115889366 n=1 Tax=Sitophilus oryzae TaxID=7048 RepID=A0A6J2YPI7_SITOR|nr:uncharacterized protein LOC115889366 [Sitophilus oryzae]
MGSKCLIFVFSISLLCLVGGTNSLMDYYWRPYAGIIPEDAYTPGKTQNGQDIYIGQVAIKPHPGVYPAPLYKGEKVVASKDGPKAAWNFVQILCTRSPEKLIWVARSKTDAHILPANVHPVIGGMEDGQLLNIGKIHFQGQTIIGKILSGNIGDAIMYYVYNNSEKAIHSYQVLAYTEFPEKYRHLELANHS